MEATKALGDRGRSLSGAYRRPPGGAGALVFYYSLKLSRMKSGQIFALGREGTASLPRRPCQRSDQDPSCGVEHCAGGH